jgi:thiamine biosynthesis protein ThiS
MAAAPGNITITVNGDPRKFEGDALTVEGLIAQLGKAGVPVAVEVNKHLVSKRNHAAHALTDGDSVELVTLVGGG